MTPHGTLTAVFAILVLVVLALCAGCGTTGHVGMMHDVAGDVDTKGQNPVCTFAVRKEVTGRITAQYYHQSWCSSGVPFNDNPESTIDAFGVEAQIW